MELFYSNFFDGQNCRLDSDESGHCIRVLRHRNGDRVNVIDGLGTLYSCTIIDDSPKSVLLQIDSLQKGWGTHPYTLTMAVCPTKNIDRFEWFAEKATELGLDKLVPLLGQHSERKVLKSDRLGRILLSAAKQSLKAAVPELEELTPVADYLRSQRDNRALKMIAYCFEDEEHPRNSIRQSICRYRQSLPAGEMPEYVVLIGPEGDFSPEEAALALECGFVPVHLGASRLRTETAALTAVEAVYLEHLD